MAADNESLPHRRRRIPLRVITGAFIFIVVAAGTGSAWLLLSQGGGKGAAAEVGASGGTVDVPGGGRIEFGAGALTESTSVGVSIVSPEDVPGGMPLDATSAGQTYRVEVAGTLYSPVTVVLPFDPNEVDTPRTETLLFVGRFDETSGVWEPLLGRVDWDAATITVRIEHFSLLSVFQRSAADFAKDVGGIFRGAAEGTLWLAGLETAEGPICTNPQPKQVERIDFSDSLLPCIEERDSTTIALQVVNNRPYGQLISLPPAAAVVQLDHGGLWDIIWGSMQSSFDGDVYLPPGARVVIALPVEGNGETLLEGRPDGATLALDLATGLALKVFPTQVEILLPFMKCVIAANQRSELPEGGQLGDVVATIRDCLNGGLFDEYLPNLLPHWAFAVEVMRGTVIAAHLGADTADGLNYVSVQYREQPQDASSDSGASAVLPAVGSRVTVIGTGDCLRIRSGPTTSSARLGCLDDGSIATIEDGPREADGYRWYRLEGHGWAAGEFLVTETVYELVRAISQRDSAGLTSRFASMRAPCGATPAYPIPCDGHPQGTNRTIYRFHDIPAPGCGAGGYQDARSALESFFRRLPSQQTALEIQFAELPMAPGQPQLIYRRLSSGDFVARVRIDPDTGMILDLSTVANC